MPRNSVNKSQRSSKSTSKKSSIDLNDIEANDGDTTSFIANIQKPSLTQFKAEEIRHTKLFQKVYTMVDNAMLETDSKDSAILVSGFGMRNLTSLERALNMKKHRKFMEAYKNLKESEEEEEGDFRSIPTQSTTSISKRIVTTTTETETEETESRHSGISGRKQQLEYLMGLGTMEEESYEPPSEVAFEKEEEFKYSTSTSMRKAQKYLRIHRIFDFFQFIIAHLLQAQPDNPIEFIVTLLNKCLLYRSGLGTPPLLYTRKHIEQLFQLMDRMQTGFVDMKQYEQGMKTLGICEYEKTPPLSTEGLVEKSVFIDEIYDAEVALFDDLIKRKWIGHRPDDISASQQMDIPISCKDLTGPYFIPSDLFKVNKKAETPSLGQSEG